MSTMASTAGVTSLAAALQPAATPTARRDEEPVDWAGTGGDLLPCTNFSAIWVHLLRSWGASKRSGSSSGLCVTSLPLPLISVLLYGF